MKSIMPMSMVLMLMMTACGSDHHEVGEKEGKYIVTSPYLKDTVITRDYVSQIKAIQHIELRALEKGYLEEIFVDEGQLVKKGQIMFQIMPMLYKAEMEKAKAEAEFARIEYENTKTLADSNIVSKNELALSKARYSKALAELELAKVHLGFTQIKAPFDGIMDRFRVRRGSLLDEGELLTSLSDNSEMWVYFNVPEAEYLDYRMSTPKDSLIPVELIMANGKKFDQQGYVGTIEADFNNETGNIAFRATFPNPNGLLRHGETGTIRISSPIKNALMIPQKATYEVLEQRYVYVIDKDNKVRSRAITVSAELPHIYVIQDGLKEGDKVLLEGLRKVKENDKIEFDYVAPEKAISELELYAE